MARKCNGNDASVTRSVIKLVGGRNEGRAVRSNTRSHAKRAGDFSKRGGDTRGRKFACASWSRERSFSLGSPMPKEVSLVSSL